MKRQVTDRYSKNTVGVLWFPFRTARFFAVLTAFVCIALPLAPVFADESVSATEATATVSEDELVLPEAIETNAIATTEETSEGVVEEGMMVVEVASVPQELELEAEQATEENESLGDTIEDTDIPDQPDEMEQSNAFDTDDATATAPPIADAEILGVSTTTYQRSDVSSTTSSTTLDNEIDYTETVEDTIVSDVENDEVDTTEVPDQVVEQFATDDTASTTATTSLNYDVVETVVQTVVNDFNKYQFGASECLSVGDGSFYCSKPDIEVPAAREDGIYALLDADGDNEIYVVKGGVEYKVTNNQAEDLAPQYDAISSRIVWQRLIDDRYQIVSKVFGSDTEEILTHNSYNSMEPAAYGDSTVWQSWVQNNWEIILYEDGSSTLLTNNDVHDIAPFINKEYIIWQTQKDGEWYMTVYDRSSKTTETIVNETGAMIENPRLVLVYDAKYDNGDVQTLGYDFNTKKITPLAAVPVQLPDSIPDPDQTGEERALIQNKSTNEEEVLIEDGNNDIGTSTPPIDPPQEYETTTGTSTDSLTLQVPAFEETQIEDSSVVLTTIDTTSLAEDLVATSTDHIPDLIVTPYEVSVSESEHASTTSVE